MRTSASSKPTPSSRRGQGRESGPFASGTDRVCDNLLDVDQDWREIRSAATVVAARPGLKGPEVLVLRPAPDSELLSGYVDTDDESVSEYVMFPGGLIEPGDEDLAARWFGTPEEAARACAVRKLAAEARLVLTGEGLREAQPDHPLTAVDAAPPRPEQLVQIWRWITPVRIPVRFDARFFAVEAPGGLEPKADGREGTCVWWARPVDVLNDWLASRCRLFWPTMKIMYALSRRATTRGILSLRLPQEELAREDAHGSRGRPPGEP